MKIIVFSYFFDPFIGGAEVAFKEAFSRISDKHEIHVITPRRKKEIPAKETIEGLHIHRVGSGNNFWDLQTYIFKGANYAKKLHKNVGFDLEYVLMANQSAFCAMFFNWLLRKENHIPSILNLQSGDSIDYIKMKVPRPLWGKYKKIYTSFDHVTAISTFLRQRAILFGANTKQAEVIPNGVNLDVFNKEKVTKSDLETVKKKLEIKSDEKVIITTSRLAFKNNIGNLIRSISYLSDKYRLIIVGSGELEDELKTLAKKTGKKIDFLGFVPNTELPKYVMSADVFIRPSISEGFGNSFIEAMALEVPIVGTNVGGIPDFLRDKDTGLFCKVDDSKDIADKLRTLCEDLPLRKKIIKNGYKESQKYSWDKISKMIDEVISKVGGKK